MRALASFIMKGRAQAVMVTTVAAMLSPLLPPLSVLSSAGVALVTLRQGAGVGLQVALLSSLAAGLLAYMTPLGVPLVLGFGLMLWLPMVGLGLLLRTTRSLPLAVEGGLLLGGCILLYFFTVFDDPAVVWAEMLEPSLRTLLQGQAVPEEDFQKILAIVSGWMTGMLAAAFFVQSAVSLFLARWWQALLYNPGGFRVEFHGLRLHRQLAYLSLPVLALWLVGKADWGLYLVLLLASAYFLQGLALAHAILARLKANPGWLVGIYALLFIAGAHAFAALAIAGYGDAWMDFRSRFGDRSGPGGES